MKKILLLLFVFASTYSIAQDSRIPLDTTIVTTNTVTIKGKEVPYKATTECSPFGTTMEKQLPLYTIPITKD